ncbi:MAG: MBOAT family protein [Lachnospiraceae bacterium]|uniref:MBOAT family O-acyltransferase n=1 Tax=Candidatus Merdisoma sp. JLR.KK011 TaxID=3114299 RepID=UPI002FEFC5FE|nr:MBOAT family protein [Lachnospiraceae bacterium]
MASDIMLTLLFLGAVLAVYYLAPSRIRWWILLAASLGFYASASGWMLLLTGASAWWSWFAGGRIEKVHTEKDKRGWLLFGILPLLGVLFLFKYFNFFSASVASVLGMAGLSAAPLVLKLMLPLGISYYTFKIISYLADIYLGKRGPEPHMGYYLTYVLFFPHILSGPIERSESFLEQLHKGLYYDSGLFAQGIQRIVLGLFKKMVIANRLGGYVDAVFASPLEYPGLAAVMAAFFYSFQLYCDFSGYSDIAIGMGELLGIRCRQNFRCPYFSRNIRDFWSRWHISLSSWLRDYVYIPLGGSRVSRVKRGRNLLLTFLASGLWHGDNWTFVAWGGLHGVWNLLSRKKKAEAIRPVHKLWQTLVTFCGVTLGWVFFRAESLPAAVSYLRRAVLGFSLSMTDIQNSILPFTGDNTCAAYFLTVCLFLLLLFLYERGQVYGKGKDQEFSLSWGWMAVMGASTALFGVFGASGFLYAQF